MTTSRNAGRAGGERTLNREQHGGELAAALPAASTPSGRWPGTGERLSARQRLLRAAEELFYPEGVHSVGIDRVIDRAGVAKATLYSVFGSKDELVRAYLEQHNETWRERLTRGLAERFDEPADRILGVFDLLSERSAEPTFHGCAFVRASAEAPPEGLIREVSCEARSWVTDMFADLAAAAGVAEPGPLARKLALLYHGATLSADMDGDLSAAATARAAAATLLAAALPSG